MAHLGVFLALISFLVTTAEGKHKHKYKNTGRIVNGIQGEQSDFPFLANVQKKTGREGDSWGAWQRWASGAIVSRYNVLTSCHVVADLGVEDDSFNKKPHPDDAFRSWKSRRTGYLKVLSWKQFRVYVGTGNNLFEQIASSQYRYARELIPHPNCEADTSSYVKNDVGVIKLQEPFEYNLRVHPISIISLDPDEALNAARNIQAQEVWCQAVGWGDTDNEQEMPHNLFWVANVQLVSNDYCWNRFDVDHYVCTFSRSQSMCSGDSGGPLVCQGFLYGLHSSSKCTPGEYNFMANIEPIVYMINQHVDLDSPGWKRDVPEEGGGGEEHVFVHPEGPNIHGGGGRRKKRHNED